MEGPIKMKNLDAVIDPFRGTSTTPFALSLIRNSIGHNITDEYLAIISMMEDLIKMSNLAGYTVLDPFCGTGGVSIKFLVSIKTNET